MCKVKSSQSIKHGFQNHLLVIRPNPQWFVCSREAARRHTFQMTNTLSTLSPLRYRNRNGLRCSSQMSLCGPVLSRQSSYARPTFDRTCGRTVCQHCVTASLYFIRQNTFSSKTRDNTNCIIFSFIMHRVPTVPSALACHWGGCLARSHAHLVM